MLHLGWLPSGFKILISLVKEKHSSLFCPSVSDEENKFYNIDSKTEDGTTLSSIKKLDCFAVNKVCFFPIKSASLLLRQCCHLADDGTFNAQADIRI